MSNTPDPTLVMQTIEDARERMLRLPCKTPAEMVSYANAAVIELGNIIVAKNLYDDAAEKQLAADRVLGLIFPNGEFMR